jgi:hypothetical protein
MKRLLVVAIIMSAVVTCLSSSALARGPKWGLVPLASFSLDASYCGFPVRVDLVVNKEFAKTYTLNDGTTVLHVTGSAKYRATSPATSLIVNASGPADVSISPDGTTTIRGRGLGFQPLTENQSEQTGLPRVGLFFGLTVLQFAPNGDAMLIRSPSRVVDLCSRLAG